MVQRPNLVGQQFGSYRLLRLLGSGGFADVYLGEHIDIGMQAAIKVLHTQLSPTDIDAFRTEARTIARLLHPHIIRVLDFNAAGSTPFLVMDYAVGGTMRERYPKGIIVPLATIISSIQQIAEALQYAHDEKLIHRDIKPENILLDQRNSVLLSDFGIALVAQTSRYQSTQNVIGTASYMSPEQIQGKPRPASDQYSLGSVVYEWLSGSPPFEGSLTELWSQHMFAPPPPLHEKVPTISREVEQVVMTALQKDPKQRFGNVRAFAYALQQASQVGQVQIIIPPLPRIDKTVPALPRIDKTIPANQQGSLMWSLLTGHAVESTPTVISDVVYIGSRDRHLYARDAASGRKMWTFRSGKWIDSSPTVVNGLVYFGSRDRNLYALDAASGEKMWVFPTDRAVTSSPTVVNGVVYFGSWDHNLYTLDATSGEKMWVFPTDRAVTSSPTVVNGIVYFGSHDHNFYALDATSGEKMWIFPTGAYVHSSPTVVNGIVYFGSTDYNLYALDATSGEKMWAFSTDGKVTSSPTVVNGVVYFGSWDHNLYALDAASRQKIWIFPTHDMVYSSPTVVNGIIYFGSADHNLYALDAASGQKMWAFLTGAYVHSSPTVVNGVVYFGSHDGRLYAFSLA